MRVFIAIELEDETKEYLTYYQEIVKKYSIKGNFTAKDNLHITLKFIGEVDHHDLDDLKKVVDSLSKRNNSFHLMINSLGNFSRGSREILWMGLKEEPLLKELYQDLEGLLESKGYERERRPYRPHITLGREILLSQDIEELRSQIKVVPRIINVKSVSLMESTRVKGKLVYLPLHRKPLLRKE